jgi:hypothetical protein
MLSIRLHGVVLSLKNPQGQLYLLPFVGGALESSPRTTTLLKHMLRIGWLASSDDP